MTPRVDPLTGAEVEIVASRQDRPNLPADGCPFCVGGREAPDPYNVRWFTNRWPPLTGHRAEVILYTPRHNASLGSLSPTEARAVVDLWASRTTALGQREDVGYVLVFENRGPEVGATISHPHGQIYAFDEVPPAPATELARSARACVLCQPPSTDLLVREGRGWRTWVPSAATWPYELRLAPDDHAPDIPSLDDWGREGLAAAVVDAVARVDRLFDAPMPYFFWIHQRPTDGRYWPAAHLHAHLAPLLRAPGTPRFVASGELGSGVFFNPVPPEEAAAALRDA